MIRVATDSKPIRNAFLIFMAIYILSLVVPLLGITTQASLTWLSGTVMVGALSLVILWKEHLPAREKIAIGAVLGLLVAIISPLSGAATFLSFLASGRILEIKAGEVELVRNPLWLTLLLGLGVGLLLGGANLLLSGIEPAFTPSFFAFLVALSPGISEEISFRLFVYAGGIYLLGGQPRGRRADLWLYFVMIVPHVLLHFSTAAFFSGGIFTFDVQIIVGILVLSVLFGLPMTLLMRKRDVASAVITHTVVDSIRFLVYGIPI